jgi:hypothetical protein
MKTGFTIDFLWVPESLGGHRSEPYTGMRLTIRWQRLLEAFLQRSRDVKCVLLGFNPKKAQWKATCSLVSNDPVPIDWLRDGVLVELLSGYRVLAVGRIVETRYD